MEKKRAEIEQIDNGYIVRLWVEYKSGPFANSNNPVFTFAVKPDLLMGALAIFFADGGTVLKTDEYINANQS